MVDSTTRNLARFKDGDSSAGGRLWQRFHHELLALARQTLQGHCRLTDEEDIVASAFRSFCRAIHEGRLQDVEDRDQLRRVLCALVRRKVCDCARYERRLKRGNGQVLGESDLIAALEQESPLGLVEGSLSASALEGQLSEELEWLRAVLERNDPELRQIAELRLEGRSIEDIASQLCYTTRTINRRLDTIRRILEQEMRS